MPEDALVLEEDGCYVDSNGIQHYLFPREVEQIEDPIELARHEFAWHMNPLIQGQWSKEIDSIEPNWEALDAEVDKATKGKISYQLFPRQTFVDYVGQDWDTIAYLEWRWYLLQSRSGKKA